MGRSAGLFLCLAIAGCAAPASLPRELTEFRFEGKPIHPAIFDEFIPWLSDGEPVVAAVDLEGFTRSGNRLCGWTVREEGGWVKGTRKVMHGYLEYRLLGVGKNGALQLDVYDSGGGSATWRYLVQLRFEVVQAFGSRRILLRCENVDMLRCCPRDLVEPGLMPEPCARHPRPIPDVEPAEFRTNGLGLIDEQLIGIWDPLSRNSESRFGRIRFFRHSLFFERIGAIPFEVISASEGRCLLGLAREVDSSRFIRIGPGNEFAKSEIEVAFYRTIKEALAASPSGSNAAESWGVYSRAN